MFPRIILFLFFLFASQNANAEVLLLKPLNLVHGDIVEVSDQGITMKLKDGQTKFFPKEKIDDEMYQAFLDEKNFKEKFGVDESGKADTLHFEILNDLRAHQYAEAKEKFRELQQITPKDQKMPHLKQLILDLEREEDPDKEGQLVMKYTEVLMQGVGDVLNIMGDTMKEIRGDLEEAQKKDDALEIKMKDLGERMDKLESEYK